MSGRDPGVAGASSWLDAWLHRDPTGDELSRQLWSMTPTERVTAMRAGRLTFDQLNEWTRKRPNEVPLLNGEFEWIAIKTPEVAED